jgi:hypothetical protein
MLAFLIPVTVMVHDFWTIEGDEKGKQQRTPPKPERNH